MLSKKEEHHSKPELFIIHLQYLFTINICFYEYERDEKEPFVKQFAMTSPYFARSIQHWVGAFQQNVKRGLGKKSEKCIQM